MQPKKPDWNFVQRPDHSGPATASQLAEMRERTHMWHALKGCDCANCIPDAEVLLHRIGGCTLRKYCRQGRWFYEAAYRGVEAVSGSPWSALMRVRRQVLKPTQVVGELTGFRVWRLRGDLLERPMLAPVVHSASAFEGPVCRSDAMPEAHNTSGLYSVKAFTDTILTELIDGYKPDAWGVVGVLGRVVDLDRGYRSEMQVVRGIRLLIASSPELRASLADRYQCEVLPAEASARAAGTWGVCPAFDGEVHHLFVVGKPRCACGAKDARSQRR